MSNISLPKHTASTQLPAAVASLITSVRSQLRRYSLLSGTLVIFTAAAIVFWLTSGIDAGWFALQRLELPTGLRSLLLIGMAAGAGWMLFHHLLKPLLRRTRDTDLALLLERRFPQFQDRLITTVEGQGGYPDEGPYVNGMLKKTADGAAQVASSVSVDDVFDVEPLKKRGWIAGALLLSVIGYAFARPGVLQQWWNAFVMCEEAYHLRTTMLDFAVLAQPGDRRVNFQEVANVPTYLHPRGEDLELEMTVPTGTSPVGQPWVMPERVRVDVIRENGSRSRTYIAPTSSGEFRFILTRLQETVSIEVLGGDFRTPVPLRIESVTPPGINAMRVDCRYPDYTGWNSERESLLPILGSEISLPIGTEFQFEADSNKPLQSVRITTDFFELSGDRESCQLDPREGYTATLSEKQPLLSADGLSFQVDLRVDLTTTSSEGNSFMGLPIPSNTSLRFFLHDEDDIISATSDTLRIQGISDKPPVIAVRTSGVSNSITRRAIIPIEGKIKDDYRVVSAGFEFIVDDETQWRPRNFRNDFQSGLTYDLEAAGGPGSEHFDVQSLELSEGQMLSLTVAAADGCQIPKANSAHSDPIVFRVVSNEELLSMLYTRELALRRRFEEVIGKLESVRNDLTFRQDVADRIDAAMESGTVRAEDRTGLSSCSTNSGDVLRRQANELQAIHENFDEIVEELINNAIPPQQLAETMRQTIVVPMKTVVSGSMVTADRSISRLRVAAAFGKASAAIVREANREVGKVISELKTILESVRDMAEFHEALSDLKSILEEQQRILDETKRESIKNFAF